MRHLLRELDGRPGFDLQLIVTGSHLSRMHGYTKDEIVSDGFTISAEVDMLLASGSQVSIGKSLGLATIGLVESLAQLQPSLLLIVGDRYEAFAAAQAAMILNIPIAHVHGGEATEGLIDEAIRHAITKMAHLHFVSADAFRRRVIQLGESPKRVFQVGALGLDSIVSLRPVNRGNLETALGIPIKKPLFIVTFHPLTLSDDSLEQTDSTLR